MIFWKNNSVAFKQVVINSATINSSVVTDEAGIAKFLNKNQCHGGKVCWRKQNNEVIMKSFDPILIIWVNL